MARGWLRLLAGVAAIVFGPHAWAQGAVQQSGAITPFHLGAWFQNGVIGDAGTPQAPFVNNVGLFNGAACPFGVSSQTSPGQSTSPYAEFSICQTATSTTLQFLGVNGQATPSVYLNVGGTIYPFPITGVAPLPTTLTNHTPVASGDAFYIQPYGTSALDYSTSAQLQSYLLTGVQSIGYTVGQGTVATAFGGTGYAVGDQITLACAGATFSTAPTVNVNAVSGGVITGVTLQTQGVATVIPSGSCTFTQAATSGGGTGASITGTFGIIAAGYSTASLTTGGGAANGTLIIGSDTPSAAGSAAIESTFVGDKAGGGFIGTAAYNSAFGHNACGNGWSGAGFSTAPSGNANSCFGNDAGRNINASATYNTLIGKNAGENVAGSYNTLVGYSAGQTLTTGQTNTAIGYTALYSQTTASSNEAIGYSSAYNITTGTYDVALGDFALWGSTTATGDVAVGHNALYANQTTGSLTAVGFLSMENTNGGAFDTALGAGTLETNTSGSSDTALGYNALFANTSGSYNIAINDSALAANTTGANNIAVGYHSLIAEISGTNNIAIGSLSGTAITTGANNIVIGPGVASTTLQSGTNNILIGTSSAVDASSGSAGNQIVIGNVYVNSLTAPTIASGFGTSPGVVHSAGAHVFTVNVGTSNTGTGIVTMAASPLGNGWSCAVTDVTTTSANVFITKQIATGSSSTAVAVQNYTDAAATHAWTDNDILQFRCDAY